MWTSGIELAPFCRRNDDRDGIAGRQVDAVGLGQDSPEAGFALGVAVTVSIAALLALASAEARGTANSLRMMGNRVGQFTIPVVAGLVAAAAGAASIFFILGLTLVAAAAAAQRRGRT